jgi:hypothetical protein
MKFFQLPRFRKHSRMERDPMRDTQQDSSKARRAGLPGSAALAFLLAAALPAHALAQQKGQKTFASPEEAAAALVQAAQGNDEKALLDILGPDSRPLVSSGDETEDAQDRARFAEHYQEMHRLVKEPDGTTTLYIGARNWPTPIPLVRKGTSWYFETAAGRKEILFRRIGRNETSTINVCRELAAAQEEYRASQGGHYARAIFSDDGQHNGLYWKTAEGEPQSPIGPLVAWAEARADGNSQAGAPAPYRGYQYRILTRQGRAAPGGARSYLAGGNLTGGFGFVAYPAEYRSSGVMTFIVNQTGVVYEKDLGRGTRTLARAMQDYNPGLGWKVAEGQREEPAKP